jgi:hypothetical protein
MATSNEYHPRASHPKVMQTRKEEVHRGFWWGNLKKRDHLEKLGLNERIILKIIFKKCDDRGGGGGMGFHRIRRTQNRKR